MLLTHSHAFLILQSEHKHWAKHGFKELTTHRLRRLLTLELLPRSAEMFAASVCISFQPQAIQDKHAVCLVQEIDPMLENI